MTSDLCAIRIGTDVVGVVNHVGGKPQNALLDRLEGAHDRAVHPWFFGLCQWRCYGAFHVTPLDCSVIC